MTYRVLGYVVSFMLSIGNVEFFFKPVDVTHWIMMVDQDSV
jgi:hypothetical protein